MVQSLLSGFQDRDVKRMMESQGGTDRQTEGEAAEDLRRSRQTSFGPMSRAGREVMTRCCRILVNSFIPF